MLCYFSFGDVSANTINAGEFALGVVMKINSPQHMKNLASMADLTILIGRILDFVINPTCEGLLARFSIIRMDEFKGR